MGVEQLRDARDRFVDLDMLAGLAPDSEKDFAETLHCAIL
jgi:hypothetical protein